MARGVFSTSNYFKYAGAPITATPLTLACWAYSLSYAVDFSYLMSLTSTNAAPDGWALLVDSSRSVEAKTWAAGASSLSGKITINADVWYHAAAVFASSVSRIAYLNGVAGTEETTSRVPATTVSRTLIGTFMYGAGTVYKPQTEGYIAEAGIWNVALTAADMLQLAAGYSPLFVKPESLVAYYPLIRGDSNGDAPNLVEGAYTMVEQGTVPIQTHARVFYPVAPIFNWDVPAGPGQIFDSWSESEGDGTIADEGSLIHAGSHAAKLTAGAGANTYIYQAVTVASSSYARLEFWTRGDGTNAGRYAVYDATNSADIIATTSTGEVGAIYRIKSLIFQVPVTCTSVQVRLYCPAANGGIAYFDDISLKYRTK